MYSTQLYQDQNLFRTSWGISIFRSRDRPIFGFYPYIGIGQNGQYRSWQNVVIFLTRADNLHKQA